MTFYEAVSAAIRDFSENGYDSEERLAQWMGQIRAAAEAQMASQRQMEEMLRAAMRAIYDRLVEKQGVLRILPGINRYTLQRVAPKLRAELDRRILASANLIRLNRDEAIGKTLRRFSGWATSLPADGSADPARRAASEDVRKALSQLPFEERRVLIDQGQKLTSAISEVVAVGGGAIAAYWRHHYVTYPRPEHVARNGKLFLIRDSWAHEQGLVKPGDAGYTDQITKPGEEILCRCTYQYVFNLRGLPNDMLTVKGREELEKARRVTA
jgi:hypothetical protein